ncbi:MAG: xanthine dehydrogenase family protein subunit M [Roseomonas sp.]|nr:xanthine dehydrogenase family protein subunit M [Roseomonas sp.]MCA3325907.1 xanthine dehydrogenase family protein subunit M [Roseomonas sp.]MCA3329990.1 xanthine dehydrogenase family protein subunit M [Roseomonas sp.]MCA3333652.1 xanthine dehydrogenase family protein subunit M [Roseomonas sp.]MCA3347593.1 xanthine dehydrogenase family protein subunit M [Roseomonas sp.]
MKWPAMGYLRAKTLAELWSALQAHGSAGQIIAGGQTLLATLAFRLSEPGTLIDITGIDELRGISVRGEALRLGALTLHADLCRNPLVKAHAPLLAAAAPLIAHPAIRNRGTIGGSLAYADPAAELPACMIALDATVITASAKGERRIPATAFFTDLLQTALEAQEIIAAVEIPLTKRLGAIEEIARRSGDYAMAGLAATLAFDAGRVVAPRLAYFGVGNIPVLAAAASRALEGRSLDRASITAAQQALTEDLDPPRDLHGPPEMKRHLARVLTERVLLGFLNPKVQAA